MLFRSMKESLEPNYLEIELTESVAIRPSDGINETLKRLKNLGVQLSIDDFGTEYSSLNRLKDLPVDRVKIDMSFVHGIGISEKDETITRALILLANTLGLGTIGEGVETKEQLDFLNNNMCDEVQGFYMYKPMPAEEMGKLLRAISLVAFKPNLTTEGREKKTTEEDIAEMLLLS